MPKLCWKSYLHLTFKSESTCDNSGKKYRANIYSALWTLIIVIEKKHAEWTQRVWVLTKSKATSTNEHCVFQVYNAQGPNGSSGKAFKVHLQLWDTAGQER